MLDVSTQRATTRVAPTEAGWIGVAGGDGFTPAREQTGQDGSPHPRGQERGKRGVGMGLGVDVGFPAGVQVGGFDGAHNVVAEFFAGCAGVAARDDELLFVLGANVQGLVEAV